MNIRKILKQYGIEDNILVQSVSEAALSHVYYIGEDLVLRGRKLSPSSIDDFIKECSLLNQIRPFIQPDIPYPLENQQRDLYIIEHEHLWTLLPRLAGKTLGDWRRLEKVKPQENSQAINTLRKLQKATTGIFGPLSHHPILKEKNP